MEAGSERPEAGPAPQFWVLPMSRYEILREGEILVIRTSSFSPERGSVLHSGIFSKELASSFVASGISLLFFLAVVLQKGHPGYVHYALGVAMFVVVFVLSRIYLFSGAYMETVIDRRRQRITINCKGLVRSRRVEKPLGELREMTMSTTEFDEENSDAVQFVSKIAAQHGTVIPGFGEKKTYHSVVLVFGDESYTIFSSRSLPEADVVLSRTRQFVLGKG